jgi:phenylalanine-4-hydroxylase
MRDDTDFASAVAASGKTASRLRGDYRHMADDYSIDQRWAQYTAADHALWRALYDRQARLLPDYAAPEFSAGLARLNVGDAIPDFRRTSDLLHKATGWRLVAVPGLIPEKAFFDHLAARRFPVTNWLRQPSEMDYLVEPDVFHDFFGHVPLLTHPVFADYLQAYGRLGAAAVTTGGLEALARLYWYMVEFGLINTPDGLRAYGAGMLSSYGETRYCLESPQPHRVGFNLERVMRTRYRIDDYQQTYFVLDSYDQLFQATKTDLAPLLTKVQALSALDPATLQPEDRLFGPVARP